MKIKRYFAPDIRQAIRMVRDEQGSDAVILSNRKVDGGVEIVAARDFDEQDLLERRPSDAREFTPRPPERREDAAAQPRFSAPEVPVRPVARSEAETARMPPETRFARNEAEAGRMPPETRFARNEAETARMPPETRRRAEDAFQEALGRFAATGDYRYPPEAEAPQPTPPRRPQTEPVAKPNLHAPEPPRPQRVENRSDPRGWNETRTQATGVSPGQAGRAGYPPEQERRGDEASSARYQPERERRGDEASSARYQPEQERRGDEASSARYQPEQERRGDESLFAMQRELRQMRRMLDTHFAESGWQAAASRAPTRLDLLRRLGALGFSRQLSLSLAERAGVDEDLDSAWNHVQDLLAMQIPLMEDNLLDYGGVVALVGPTGVGKTTTIAKLAARFRLKHGPRQVALITLDNFRIGAHEQLNTYGRILDVPVRAASSTEELRHLLAGFQDRRLVLIDTAGMSQRDVRLAEQIELFRRADAPLRSYLVLSAASQGRVLREAIAAFDGYAPHACILTKLDEAAQIGMALSAVVENRLPVAFLCDGQQVPADLHVAKTQLLLNRCAAEIPDEEDRDPRPLTHQEWAAHAHF